MRSQRVAGVGRSSLPTLAVSGRIYWEAPSSSMGFCGRRVVLRGKEIARVVLETPDEHCGLWALFWWKYSFPYFQRRIAVSTAVRPIPPAGDAQPCHSCDVWLLPR